MLKGVVTFLISFICITTLLFLIWYLALSFGELKLNGFVETFKSIDRGSRYFFSFMMFFLSSIFSLITTAAICDKK